MCYEFSEWSWKLRAAELARKERDAANAEKMQGEPVKPAQPATAGLPKASPIPHALLSV